MTGSSAREICLPHQSLSTFTFPRSLIAAIFNMLTRQETLKMPTRQKQSRRVRPSLNLIDTSETTLSFHTGLQDLKSLSSAMDNSAPDLNVIFGMGCGEEMNAGYMDYLQSDVHYQQPNTLPSLRVSTRCQVLTHNRW